MGRRSVYGLYWMVRVCADAVQMAQSKQVISAILSFFIHPNNVEKRVNIISTLYKLQKKYHKFGIIQKLFVPLHHQK